MPAAGYGFEYNAIRIEGACWYEAADMNDFHVPVSFLLTVKNVNTV
jgi:hypothetical protein